MKIMINAGHTKMGKGTGAVGYVNESRETRKIAFELMKLLTESNHEIVPVVIDKSNDYLKEVVNITNKAKADLFVSIHLNAGKGQGCEVYTYKGRQHAEAVKMCQELNKLGFKNRGVKDGTKFYVVRETTCKALLLEVCFVDTKSDVDLYSKHGVKKIAQAIYNSIV